MRLKMLLATVTGLFAVGTANAQDKIFMSDGSVIDAKVEMVTTNRIKYKLFNNLDGPQYSVAKRNVDKIKYQNGTEDRYVDADRESQPTGIHEINNDKYVDVKTKLRKQLIGFSPLQFTENGVGFSISYERVLDKDGIITFNIPFITTFDLANNNNNAVYNNGVEQKTNQDAMVYLSPGLKFYPSGCYGNVTYAIGPSLVIGAGQHTTYNSNYDPVTYQYIGGSQTQDKFILGIMITNSLNMNVTKKFYLGLDLGLGFTYINQLGGVTQPMNGIVQGGFKMGYRF